MQELCQAVARRAGFSCDTPRSVHQRHTVRNPTEAAYARSDLFERRRRLMDDWAAYLGGARGHVVA